MSLSSAEKNKRKSSPQGRALGGTSVVNADLQFRLDAQKSSPKLSVIDMFIGDEGAFLVSKFLKDNTHYETLEIRGNNISAVGFGAICEGLKFSKRIKTIAAEWNQIGSDTSGLVALHELVRTRNTVTILDLRNNHIGFQSAGAIASIIRDCDSLQTLDLRWNDLGDDGAKLLLSTLRNSHKKIQIDLNGNKIHEELLAEIASFDPYHEPLNTSIVQPKERSRSRSPQRSMSQEEKSMIQDRQSFQARQIEATQNLKNSQVRDSYPPRKDDYTPVRNPTQLSSRSIPTTSQKPGYQSSQYQTPLPYTRPTAQPTPNPNPLKRSNVGYNPEYDIKELQSRYENEAKDIREKYENHIQAHLKMGKAITELELIVEDERARANHAEEKLILTVQDLEAEKNFRIDLEARCKQLVDELRKKDQYIEEINYDNETYKREIGQMRAEIAQLKDENIRLDSFYKQKMRETDEKHHNVMREATTENDSLRNQIERMRIDNENRSREIQRDHELTVRKLEDQLRNLTHVNSDVSDELRRQTEYIQKLKIEHDEELRRVAHEARDDEYRKAQVAIRDLDNRFQSVQAAHDDLGRKNNEMLKDLQDYERQIRDLQIRYENETTRQRADIEKLRDQLNQANAFAERQKGELFAKENTITRLGQDIENLERDLQRQRASDAEALERVRREFEFERRRHEEIERELSMKIAELERKLKEAHHEIHRVRGEYDRLGDMLQSNITKVIAQTIVDHGRSNVKFSGDNL